MIWTHETKIPLGDDDILIGWDTVGEDYEGSFYEPPTSVEIEWEQISHDHIELDDDDRAYIDRMLAGELREMKDSAEEDAAENWAFDREYGL